MKLGFEELQTPYESASQSARVWTERWVREFLIAPTAARHVLINTPPISLPPISFAAPAARTTNSRVQKNKFSAKVLDGAFQSMCERVAATNNPNLLLLNYDLKSFAVTNLFVVPKQFFVREVIEERKPLASTARRAGWIGCKILLNEIPDAGKIFFVRNGRLEPKNSVLEQWQRTLFLRQQEADARGWLIEVMKCVELIGKPEFRLDDVYDSRGN